MPNPHAWGIAAHCDKLWTCARSVWVVVDDQLTEAEIDFILGSYPVVGRTGKLLQFPMPQYHGHSAQPTRYTTNPFLVSSSQCVECVWAQHQSLDPWMWGMVPTTPSVNTSRHISSTEQPRLENHAQVDFNCKDSGVSDGCSSSNISWIWWSGIIGGQLCSPSSLSGTVHFVESLCLQCTMRWMLSELVAGLLYLPHHIFLEPVLTSKYLLPSALCTIVAISWKKSKWELCDSEAWPLVGSYDVWCAGDEWGNEQATSKHWLQKHFAVFM